MSISRESSRLSRRKFTKVLTAAAASSSLVEPMALPQKSCRAATTYAGLNTGRYLGKAKTETKVKDTVVFTEGPAIDSEGMVYFTNVPARKILKWDPAARELGVFRFPSHEANGLLFDPQGNLLACEGSAGRVTRTNQGTGEIEVLADEFGGFPFAPPNDLCMDQQGRIYFTSRPGAENSRQGNVNSVYRIDQDGFVDQILRWPEVHMPNGIVISPDNQTLYLIEAHPDADHHRDIRAYDLAVDGTVSNGRVHVDFYPGRSGDGMCIDEAGNLYVAAGLHELRGTSETLDTRPGIHVISPQGKLVGYQETPEDTITNCAFGGEDLRTLYVTCGSLLISMRTDIPGKSN